MWEDEHRLVEQDLTDYITNPLNAFLMIKRATADIELIRNRFPEQSKDLFRDIEKLLPDNEDLIGAVEGLLRLQKVFTLESVTFANGFIGEKKTRAQLSAHDLFVIGKKAYAMPDEEFFAREYLSMACERIEKDSIDKHAVEQEALEMITRSYNATADYKKAFEFVKILIRKYPLVLEFKQWKESFTQSFVQFGSSNLVEVSNPLNEDFERNGKYEQYKETVLYGRVCRGESKKSQKELSKLNCRFVARSHFSRIAPFKAEEVNLEPYILLFHDVLSDFEIDYLKEASKPKVERAGVFNENHTSRKSSSRVAQFAWHHDTDHEVIQKISQRIEVSDRILYEKKIFEFV